MLDSLNYDYLSSPIKLEVTSWKESPTEKNTVYFNIQLDSKGNKWFVEKRFSEFDGLVKNMKVSFHNIPVLPGKTFLFKMSDKDLEGRRAGLEDFLRKIIIRNDLMNSDSVKQFLQLDKNASEIIVNPPKLVVDYTIEGTTKGVRDYYYNEAAKAFIIVTGDMSPMSKLKTKVTNTKLPWEAEGAKMLEVGTVEVWQHEDGNTNFIKKFSKGYPQEAMAVSYDPASKRISVGLEDGVIDVIMETDEGYEDIACAKTHQSRVTGLAYDSLNNVLYSTSLDKVFRVGHGSSLALIVGVPHKDQILSMLRDTLNKRLLVGTKGGEVILYDISSAEKPKLMTTLENNKHGGIRSMHFDTARNYLFTGSYDDGEINLFHLDKPGRQKLAQMVATFLGKEKVRAVTWAPNRTEVISGTADGSVTFWNKDGKSIYVLECFDNEITNLTYLEQSQTLIISSKSKTIKLFKLPKHWRDNRLVAKEQEDADKLILQTQKEKVMETLKKAEMDSDDDDLAMWHLD